MTVIYTHRKVLKNQQKAAKKKAKLELKHGQKPPTTFFTPASEEPFGFLRLIENWNTGEMPSNHWLQSFFGNWEQSPLLREDRGLSPTGQSLVIDLKRLARVILKVLQEKNGDEIIQKFFMHARLSTRSLKQAQRAKGQLTIVDDPSHGRKVKIFGRRRAKVAVEVGKQQERVRKDAKDLINLMQLMVSSKDFRSMIFDGQALIDDLFEIANNQKETRKSNSKSDDTADTAETESKGPTIEIYPPHTQSSTKTNEVMLTKQETNKLVTDAKRIFKKISGNKLFSNAFKDALSLLSKLQDRGQESLRTMVPTSNMKYDANMQASRRDLIEILERFAGNAKIAPISDRIQEILEVSKKDYEIKDLLDDWNSFLKKCSSNREYLESEEYLVRGEFLINRLLALTQSHYKELIKSTYRHIKDFMNSWRHDKVTTEIGEVLSKIVNQDILGRPKEGGLEESAGGFLKAQEDLVNDVRTVLGPALLRTLHELPLPHIEITQKNDKVTFDNIVLPAALFAPANIDITTKSDLHLDSRGLLGGRRQRVQPTSGTGPGLENKWKSSLRTKIGEMKGSINNINFAMDKQSWPRLKDSGQIDVSVGGSGIQITTQVATNISPALRSFSIQPSYVRVHIDVLKLKFYHVDHKTLFNVAAPLIARVMKSRIERAICDQSVALFEGVDAIAKRISRSVAVNRRGNKTEQGGESK